jgi:hypothetical protein
VLDARWDEVIDMPSDSAWPILVALATAAIFAMLLLDHVVTAAVFCGLALCLIGAWTWREPHEA